MAQKRDRIAANAAPSARVQPRRQRRPLLVALPVVAAALAAVLAVAVRSADRDRGAGGGLAAIGGDDPGVAHVHGLGVDPADGVLYAATHYGLFRIPASGEPQRVANRYQDTMGFTVVGPRHFLGSGHPDLREKDLPPRLGLIESTDAGQTWQKLSLLGKADFHALHTVDGVVYGYDSGGRFMVSADKTTWETRSTVPMRDFAVSPADANTIVATTEAGLQRSTDGGRSFTPVAPPAPRLVVLAWPDGARLFGLTDDGAVVASADSGATWTPRGRVAGTPEAFVANASELLAATNTGIYSSADDGATWTLRFKDASQ